MIFVLESYLKNRKSKQVKVNGRKEAMQEWLDRKNAMSSYTHYTKADYYKTYPRPIDKAAPILAIGATATALFLAFAGFIWVLSQVPDSEIAKTDSNPNGCAVQVNKGDKVAIKSGDFDGSKGEVVGQTEDCEINITLTNSTYTIDRCLQTRDKWNCENTKKDGEVTTIKNSKDVIKL